MGEWILTEEEMEAEHFWGPLVDYGYDAIKCLAIEQDAKTKRILEQEGLLKHNISADYLGRHRLPHCRACAELRKAEARWPPFWGLLEGWVAPRCSAISGPQ